MSSFDRIPVAGAIWAQGYRFALQKRADRARIWSFYRTLTDAQHGQACAPCDCDIVRLEYVHVPLRAP